MYSVDRQKLLLDQLSICLNDPAPILFGVHPKTEEGEIRLFDFVYEALRHPVAYTGGLLLARDFIKELYVHMGFHPAWKYRNVHELVFRDGELVEQTDRSDQIGELRQEIANWPLEPGKEAKKEQIESWIKKCFSQDYRW